MNTPVPSLLRAPLVVLLAWLVPGLGHIFLGHRIRGVVLLVAITVTFWTGVALGGVKTVTLHRTVEVPQSERRVARFGGEANLRTTTTTSWWFLAQVLNGSYSLIASTTARTVDDYSPEGLPRYLAWPAGDIGAVYTGVAGLLNLLIIIDALARTEMAPAPAPAAGPNPRRRGGGR